MEMFTRFFLRIKTTRPHPEAVCERILWDMLIDCVSALFMQGNIHRIRVKKVPILQLKMMHNFLAHTHKHTHTTSTKASKRKLKLVPRHDRITVTEC